MFIDTIWNAVGNAAAFRTGEGETPIFEMQYFDLEALASGSSTENHPRSFELANVDYVGSQATWEYQRGMAGTASQSTFSVHSFGVSGGTNIASNALGFCHNISDSFTSQTVGDIQVDAGSNDDGNWVQVYQNGTLEYVLQTIRSKPLTDKNSTTTVTLPLEMPDTNYKVSMLMSAWVRMAIVWSLTSTQFNSKCYRTNTTSALTGTAHFTAVWVKS